MRSLFVSGAHTDVGKTYVACALLRAARARGFSVDAVKPVVSGFSPEDWAESDPGRLLQALDRPLDCNNLDTISPLRFLAPLSPPMAARLEGRDLRLEDVQLICNEAMAESSADFLLIEGVGGVMSPIAEDGTGLDLMRGLQFVPTVLVGGSYLGAISHTLTAIETLRAKGLIIEAVVVSESDDPEAPDFIQTVESVAAFAGDVLVLAARRNDDLWTQGLF